MNCFVKFTAIKDLKKYIVYFGARKRKTKSSAKTLTKF